MRTLTNDHRDTKVLNLGPEGKYGPYLATQTGVDPSDNLVKTKMFVLRPDGCWVDFNAYACQGKPEAMDEIVFPSMHAVMETFGRLPRKPRVLDLPVDETGLKAWLSRHKDGDPVQAARAWASEYTARRREQKQL